MTTVTATLTGPAGVPARGYVQFVPTTGWNEPEEVGSLPLPKTVAIGPGGVISTTLEPSEASWAWAITFQVLGLVQFTKYYAVPDVATVEIDDLVEVDIQTLLPAAMPDPSWYAYVDAIVAGQVGKVVVVTGNESRPGFGSVFWVGGTTQPTNMAENTDIWFKAPS